MSEKNANDGGRAGRETGWWPTRTFWKWNAVVMLALIVLVQAPIWLRGFGEEIDGEVVDAFIRTPTGGRGMKVPSVVLRFKFSWDGEVHERVELYDPRTSWSRNWGEDDDAAANLFISNHPRGKAITVWVPRLVPWEATVVPALTSEPVRHLGRWMFTIALVATYLLGLVGAVVLWRMFLRWRDRHKADMLRR